MPIAAISRPLCRTVLAVSLFMILALAGCSDQAPEPKPAAEANATAAPEAANATVTPEAVNATVTPEAVNATVAPEAVNATVALADVLAGNASLLAPDLSPEAASATLAACALQAPEKKAPARPKNSPARQEKPASKPARSSASAVPAKARSSAGPLTQERAQQEFISFARKWVSVLSKNMLGNAGHMAVTKDGSGYVARFAEVEQDSMEFEVKATDSPTCPFVGILKYFETSYEARGDSPEAAKIGAFSRVRKVRVTELFRHSGTRWE